GAQLHEQETHQRLLTGACRPGEEVEGPRNHMKGDVAEDLWAIAVAQPDIFKADHVIALDPLNIRPNLRLYAELAVRYQWMWARAWAGHARPQKPARWWF